jgi:hypothetical protein
LQSSQHDLLPPATDNDKRRHTLGCWFDTGAFQNAAAGQFGDVGRNTMDGPVLQQWDFSAVKTIPIRESMRVEFRAEVFNIFNNVNFELPINDINSPGFGQIEAAARAHRATGAQVQLLDRKWREIYLSVIISRELNVLC